MINVTNPWELCTIFPVTKANNNTKNTLTKEIYWWVLLPILHHYHSHSPKKSPSWKDFEAQCHHCIKKKRVQNKTFPLVYCNIKNPWDSRCFRCSSSWVIEIKTQHVALIINKLKIMQSIFTFSLRRFHSKQVYGYDQIAKGFFSYCEAYFIVKPVLALNKVINILRARKIQKLIANGGSTIIICKIRDLTPYAP